MCGLVRVSFGVCGVLVGVCDVWMCVWAGERVRCVGWCVCGVLVSVCVVWRCVWVGERVCVLVGMCVLCGGVCGLVRECLNVYAASPWLE